MKGYSEHRDYGMLVAVMQECGDKAITMAHTQILVLEKHTGNSSPPRPPDPTAVRTGLNLRRLLWGSVLAIAF